MRVFVAYGYTDSESWVKKYVIPMLGSMGIEVLTGHHLPGRPISDEVERHIRSSDALIGFLLRRLKNPDGTWTSSDYVRREISIAFQHNKAVTQVVETDITPVDLSADIQRLPYDESTQSEFLVRLVRHIRDWIRGEVYVKLAPPDLVDEIATHGASGINPCQYEVRHQGQLERKGTSEVYFDGGSLCVKLIGFREGRLADVSIDANGRRWTRRGVSYSDPFVTITLARRP